VVGHGYGSCKVDVLFGLYIQKCQLQSLNSHEGRIVNMQRSAWTRHELQPSESLPQVPNTLTCDCLWKGKQRNCDGFSLQKRHGRRKWYIFSDIWNGFSFYEMRGFVILPRSLFFSDQHSYATCIYKVRVNPHEAMMQTLRLAILQHVEILARNKRGKGVYSISERSSLRDSLNNPNAFSPPNKHTHPHA
jgi:hypothetical protein